MIASAILWFRVLQDVSAKIKIYLTIIRGLYPFFSVDKDFLKN